jgi:hypothetical protein
MVIMEIAIIMAIVMAMAMGGIIVEIIIKEKDHQGVKAL